MFKEKEDILYITSHDHKWTLYFLEINQIKLEIIKSQLNNNDP